MATAQCTPRLIPFGNSVVHVFRASLMSIRKAPSLVAYHAFLADIEVARLVCDDTEGLQAIAAEATWDMAIMAQGISRTDAGVAEYEESIA
jgi:hypothetical protein